MGVLLVLIILYNASKSPILEEMRGSMLNKLEDSRSGKDFLQKRS